MFVWFDDADADLDLDFDCLCRFRRSDGALLCSIETPGCGTFVHVQRPPCIVLIILALAIDTASSTSGLLVTLF